MWILFILSILSLVVNVFWLVRTNKLEQETEERLLEAREIVSTMIYKWSSLRQHVTNVRDNAIQRKNNAGASLCKGILVTMENLDEGIDIDEGD